MPLILKMVQLIFFPNYFILKLIKKEIFKPQGQNQEVSVPPYEHCYLFQHSLKTVMQVLQGFVQIWHH